MFGNNPPMSRLESRKQLLIAESELNREQLLAEIIVLTAGVHAVAGRVKSFGSIASTAALLAAGVAAFRRGASVAAFMHPPWLQSILKGAGLVSTLWLAFRSRGREQKDK